MGGFGVVLLLACWFGLVCLIEGCFRVGLGLVTGGLCGYVWFSVVSSRSAVGVGWGT